MIKKGKPSDMKAWVIVLISFLDDIAILALIFLALWYFNIKITLPIILTVALVTVVLFFIIYKAIIPSLRKPKIDGAEGMIGMTGDVTQLLRPNGVVKVRDEYWHAKSISGEIGIGEEVEIVGINRLVLEVKRKSQ